jgi:hypothetical protein
MRPKTSGYVLEYYDVCLLQDVRVSCGGLTDFDVGCG